MRELRTMDHYYYMYLGTYQVRLSNYQLGRKCVGGQREGILPLLIVPMPKGVTDNLPQVQVYVTRLLKIQTQWPRSQPDGCWGREAGFPFPQRANQTNNSWVSIYDSEVGKYLP